MIRIASKADIDRIKELSTNFFNASPYREMELSEEKQLSVIHNLIEAYPYDGIILCLWANGVIQGILAATVTEIAFSHAKIASEIVWWVEPEYRGTKGSILLLDGYEWWAARVTEASLTQMVALEDENIDKTNKFYKRRGYIPVERGFIKHIGRN